MEDERKLSGRLFQVNGVATLKLRLPSSVAVLGTARSPPSAEPDENSFFSETLTCLIFTTIIWRTFQVGSYRYDFLPFSIV